MTERRCEVKVPPGRDVGAGVTAWMRTTCGAPIVEGGCREFVPEGAHCGEFPLHPLHVREFPEFDHSYDGWICEAGHPVEAEVNVG